MAHEEEKHVKGALYISTEELLGMITCIYIKNSYPALVQSSSFK